MLVLGRVADASSYLFIPAVEHHSRLLLDLLELRFALSIRKRADAIDLRGGLLVDLGILRRLMLRRSLTRCQHQKSHANAYSD